MGTENQNILEETKQLAEMLVGVEIDRFKLKSARAITRYLSLLIKFVICLVLGGTALISATIALALYWGKQLGSLPLAFLYIAGSLIGIVILVLLLAKHLFVRPILKGLIQEIFDEE